jgi:hypothetical protein
VRRRRDRHQLRFARRAALRRHRHCRRWTGVLGVRE